MAVTTASDVFFLRVSGLGDANGPSSTPGAYMFTTGALPSGWSQPTGVSSTVLQLLASVPSVPPAKLDPLATLASDIELAWTLIYEPANGSTVLRAFLDGRRSALTSSGEPVRLTKALEPADRGDAATLTVTDASGITSGDRLWIGNELVTASANGSGTTCAIVRGRGLTLATAHPVGTTGVGAVVWSELPTPRGQYCEFGRVESDGTEEVLFRGFVSEWTLTNATTLTVKAATGIGRYLKQKVAMPTALAGDYSPRKSVEFIPYTGRVNVEWKSRLYVDVDQHADTDWGYARFVNDSGQWAVFSLSGAVDDTIDVDGEARNVRAYTVDDDDADANGLIAVGVGDLIYDITAMSGIGQRDLLRGIILKPAIARIEFAYVDAGADLGSTIYGLLTGASPVGAGAGMPSEIVQASADFRETFARAFFSNCNNADGLWVAPYVEDATWGDTLRDWFLRPLYCGLVNVGGQVQSVSWDTDGATAVALTSADIAQGAYTFSVGTHQKPEVTVVRLGSVEFQWDTIENLTIFGVPEDRVVGWGLRRGWVAINNPNAVSDAVGGEPDTITITAALAGRTGALVEKIRGILAIWGGDLPVFTIAALPTSTDITVGSLVTVNRSDFPGTTGAIGAEVIKAIVTERGENPTTRVQTLTCVAYDWRQDQAEFVTYSPTGTVTAYDGGTSSITIAANSWTSSASGIDDIDAFNFSEDFDIYVTDAQGVLIANGQGTVTAVNTTTRKLVWDGAGTPVAGNLVMLAPYDQQSAAFKALEFVAGVGGPPAWLAGTDGQLGGAGDTGGKYR